jgi:membrane-bound lytic murein transglycosylase B
MHCRPDDHGGAPAVHLYAVTGQDGAGCNFTFGHAVGRGIVHIVKPYKTAGGFEMTIKRIMRHGAVPSLALALMTGSGAAASCGDTGAGFDAWKAGFAAEARTSGVQARGLQALASAQYASRTISADRNQKSFRYTLSKFMQIRGADTIVAQGRKRKARDAGFYAALERQYGVPAGVLIAIHGMETAFGGFMGDSDVVSAIVTLTYDCRRSDFFRPHAIGALKLVDQGAITGSTKGAKHGELGHTQFLPGNALSYGVDANGDGRVDFYNQTDALASTANFLRQKGWAPGKGYQEGQPNFAVIKQWNAATVYQQAIAIMGARIDG